MIMATSVIGQLVKTLTQLNLFNSSRQILQRSIQTSSPQEGKMKFIKLGINVNKYSLHPIHLPKSGGRGHNGRIQTHGVGGGHRQRYRMIDFKRSVCESGETRIEKVLDVRYDPCRSADIAVVAGGEKARYILASENMKKGDIIKSSSKLTRITVRADEGDSHPLGSLPIGTLVHNIEQFPNTGGKVARAAGTCGLLVRKVNDRCIVRMPSKREMNISQECLATVGRVSNINHNKEHIGSAGRARWFGVRPDSGLWQRKTGYHGRKIRPIKKAVVYNKLKVPRGSVYQFTV